MKKNQFKVLMMFWSYYFVHALLSTTIRPATFEFVAHGFRFILCVAHGVEKVGQHYSTTYLGSQFWSFLYHNFIQVEALRIQVIC